jgi:hypothetical protein
MWTHCLRRRRRKLSIALIEGWVLGLNLMQLLMSRLGNSGHTIQEAKEMSLLHECLHAMITKYGQHHHSNCRCPRGIFRAPGGAPIFHPLLMLHTGFRSTRHFGRLTKLWSGLSVLISYTDTVITCMICNSQQHSPAALSVIPHARKGGE